jgi:hypothetical protein
MIASGKERPRKDRPFDFAQGKLLDGSTKKGKRDEKENRNNKKTETEKK